MNSEAFHLEVLYGRGMCCKKYFEAIEVACRFSLCGQLEEAYDELRLPHCVVSV